MLDAKTYRKMIRASPEARKRAKELRADLSEPERMVLWALRSSPQNDLKVRVQEPIGPYIADFYCHRARLVIEIDGQNHGGERLSRDRVRDDWMGACGIEVLRIRAADVYADLAAVHSTILFRARRRIEALRY